MRECSRCRADLIFVTKRKYVMQGGRLVEICQRCEQVQKDLVNVFHALGEPDVKRDRSQTGYTWY
jgi:hypothetical protein